MRTLFVATLILVSGAADAQFEDQFESESESEFAEVGVFDVLAGAGVSPEEAEAIGDFLLARLLESKVPTTPVKGLIERLAPPSRERLAACEREPACLRPLVPALGVTHVLLARVVKLGSSYLVNVTLVSLSGGVIPYSERAVSMDEVLDRVGMIVLGVAKQIGVGGPLVMTPIAETEVPVDTARVPPDGAPRITAANAGRQSRARSFQDFLLDEVYGQPGYAWGAGTVGTLLTVVGVGYYAGGWTAYGRYKNDPASMTAGEIRRGKRIARVGMGLMLTGVVVASSGFLVHAYLPEVVGRARLDLMPGQGGMYVSLTWELAP